MILYRKGGSSSGAGSGPKTAAGKAAQKKYDDAETARRDSAKAARHDAMMQEGTQGWKPKKKAKSIVPYRNLNPYKVPNIYGKAQDGAKTKARPVKQEEKAEIFQIMGTLPEKNHPDYAKREAAAKLKIKAVHDKYGQAKPVAKAQEGINSSKFLIPQEHTIQPIATGSSPTFVMGRKPMARRKAIPMANQPEIYTVQPHTEGTGYKKLEERLAWEQAQEKDRANIWADRVSRLPAGAERDAMQARENADVKYHDNRSKQLNKTYKTELRNYNKR